MSDLKPCPFCGATDCYIEEPQNTDSKMWEVCCGGVVGATLPDGAGYCGASVHGETKAEALAAWNARPVAEVPSESELQRAWEDAAWTRKFCEGNPGELPFGKMEALKAIHALLIQRQGGR